MDRIKNLNEVLIGDFDVLGEIISVKKSDLIIPDSVALEIAEEDYVKVIKTGKDVTKYLVGDVILKMNTKNMFGFLYKKRKILVIPQHTISIAVHADNFDPNSLESKKSKIKA